MFNIENATNTSILASWGLNLSNDQLIIGSDYGASFLLKTGGTTALTLNTSQNATFSGSVTAVGISSTTQTTTSGYFATSTTIPSNQIVHVRDNVATASVSSAGGIKISSNILDN